MVLFAELECSSDDLGEFLYTNEEEIQNYLDDNGYGDEDYEFSRLQKLKQYERKRNDCLAPAEQNIIWQGRGGTSNKDRKTRAKLT